MLACITLVFLVFRLFLSEALTFSNVKVVPVDGVPVLGDDCIYKGKRFSSSVEIPDSCERWACYAETAVVVVTECGDLPRGCFFSSRRRHLPFCCNTTCDMKSYTCLTPDNRLMGNGEVFSSRHPCVKYHCKNGVLVTQTCPTYVDPKCSASHVDECAPYPACCGVAKVCAG
uniref:8.9 kDa family member n=1 Tax=Rhipicephalus zambeziensis TaxID=60191 RepID=A0A224YA84_9ACAR